MIEDTQDERGRAAVPPEAGRMDGDPVGGDSARGTAAPGDDAHTAAAGQTGGQPVEGPTDAHVQGVFPASATAGWASGAHQTAESDPGSGPDVDLFGRPRESFSQRYHLTRRGKAKRLGQIARIMNEFDVRHGLNPRKLRAMFEALGPTFVKVGQMLSMRSEILPQSYCEELAKLRADADPMPYETVLEVLAREYGRPVDELFESIDPKPLGSASLAQVHRATLVTGEDVAVKVQRPGVRQTMAQDVAIMRSIARTATRVMGSNLQVVDLGGVVEELWDTFEDETDFLVEARHLAEFKRFCQPYRYMDCPKPYMDLCTPHVVVMDYVDGISLNHTDALIEAGYDLKEIGTKLVDNYATQILDDGFFHADPHPGNIIVSDGEIVLIDLGMTGRLSRKLRDMLKQMVLAVGKQDSPALADGLLRFSGAGSSPEDYPGLLSDLDDIVEEYGTIDLADLNIADFMTSLASLAQRHGIAIPSSITTTGRALVTLEGTLDEFIPDVNMIQIITNHVAAGTKFSNAAKERAQELGIQGDKALHGALSAIADSRVAMRMLTRGQLRVNMEVVSSKEPMRQLSDMVNRLTMALIVVGLFIGSSIVYYAGMKPIVFGIPVVGFMGYVVAFILGAWIVFDIYFKGRKAKKGAQTARGK
ncbi:ubiquinone biosynthesis protein [Bifidobacterium bohemicum]|uniref:ABC1 family protein kinase n=1 Tax=Bifidobacterium bohemicum DSM 22767 TaxID=1437606 RepID=A0A086ZF40_9BIFI|nr:lipopolysaccharide core heptose(II) kinase RfaY [Bifidobacterium bohemicum]KFI45140.1 ABC1 family protein kinase [Bifidobacterium bohemicum DSM 22767]SCB90579.1 ubiquinone biosynthesis protein [Bifidobacterium bohemicum]